MPIFFVWLFCLISISLRAADSRQSPADSRQPLAESRQWQKLLHRERDLFFQTYSQVDSEKFFLAADGKKNALAELEATLQALRSDPDTACRFPARLTFLKKHFADLGTYEHCKDFMEFKTSLGARSVTMVFSSYFLNAPASAFGHTFLRLNKAPHDMPAHQKRELLDAGINFGAVETTQNPFLYPIYGLTGVFRAEFSRLPYYFKVREYGDFESRDLWEYHLNLSQDEIDLLVAHVWEMGSAHFDYYYLTENCSFHMLTVLEAAAPRLRLTEKLPFWTLPSETIRLIHREPGLLHSLSYRPSLRATFFSRAQKLQGSEASWVKRLSVADNEQTLNELTASSLEREAKIRILEAASDRIDYLHPPQSPGGEDRPEWNRVKLRILVARSRLGTSAVHQVPVPALEAPHKGHPPKTLGLRAQGGSKGEGYLFLDFRFALRDHLDPLAGYPQGSTLEFLKISLRMPFVESQHLDLTLEELTFFTASTLNTLSSFEKKPSWKIKVTTRRESLWDCGKCRPFGAEFGLGYHALLSEWAQLRLTTLFEADVLMSSHFPKYVSLQMGPYVEAHRRTFDRWGYFASYRGRMSVHDWGAYRQAWGGGLFFDMPFHAQIRLTYQWNREKKDLWEIGFRHYF